MSGIAAKLLNVTLYELGWWLCVLGAAWGYPHIAAGLALLPLAAHLVLADARQAEASLMVCACLIGVVVDSALQALGLLRFKSDPSWPLWLPLWVVAIWAQFATLFEVAWNRETA